MVMESGMRIAIVGAGAMGTVFGAALRRAGKDATLVDVSYPLVEHLTSRGAIVDEDGSSDRVRIPATTDPASLGTVDAVIMFVKCYQTEAAAKLARPLVGRDTIVASLQNGWGNEDILARHYGAQRVVAGVTYHSARTSELGRVSHTSRGPTYIGPFDGGGMGAAERLGQALSDVGIETHVTPAIGTQMWQKLVLNCATLPIAALSGLGTSGLGAVAEVRELVLRVAAETCAVARAAGYDVDPGERIETISRALDAGGDGKASMLQDIEAGRRTELDVITGAVLEQARACGVEAPLNALLFALVRGYEQAHGLA
jgi:2-dehydropantoate 2-reductase